MFSRKTPTEKKLCVSDHVPSRGSCFPGKYTQKISYASLITFLAGAFVFQENCQNDNFAGLVFSNGAAAGIKIAKIRFSLAGHFQTAPLRELVLRQLKK